MRSRRTVGFYSLADFIGGVVPRCRAYIFANAFLLEAQQAAVVHSRLDAEGATAVWMYAPGCFGPAGFDPARAEAVTGIRLAAKARSQGSRGTGVLEGHAWGWPARVEPCLAVNDPSAEILGHYTFDNAVSAARRRLGKHRSVFVGDLAVNADVLRVLFEQAGAHIWTRGGEVVHTDGRFLVIHRGSPGAVTVHLPEGVRGEVLDRKAVEQGPDTLLMRLVANETVWLRLLR